MSYLAPPIGNPIYIDPGVKYFYVIAQQGATSITVDPNPHFNVHLDFGEPALLTFTYTGPTYPSNILNERLTIRINSPTGSIAQTLFFDIFPTGSRVIPNIQNKAGFPVAPGAPLNIIVGTDIPASIAAENLPGSLAISSVSGITRITGTAPTGSGFYVITLIARGTSLPYKRYFVLTVGTGGPGGSGGPVTIGWATPPDLSRCLFDGDFTQAQLAGTPVFEIPFKSDPQPYAYRVPFWQFLSNYAEPPFGTPGPLGGTYQGGTPGTFKSIGGGIIEFWREYAVVPNTRSEYESHIYRYQFYFPLIGRGGIGEIPVTTQSRVQFDYFQTDDPENSINLPKAPIMWAPGAVFFLHGWLSIALSPTGTEVLAEDATYKLWRGNIYERQQRFINWISPNEVLFA
jgi:hypothetical protein